MNPEPAGAAAVRCNAWFGDQAISVGSEGVLVLHDQPSAPPLHDNERPDLPLVFVLHPVGRCEGAGIPARHSDHRDIGCGEPDLNLLRRVGHALQEGGVDLLQQL